MHQIQQAVIKTIFYSDIFDYPLTQNELWKYAFTHKKFTLKEMQQTLKSLSSTIDYKHKYYFLIGRESIVTQRLAKQSINEKKIQRAKLIASILSKIPTILFIGISGSVAMKNAEKEDDIDLFFITSANTVWISRLLVTLLLLLFRVKRGKHAIAVADAFCANMFVGKDALSYPTKKQNIYIAHEIMQLVPLFSVGNIYQTFIYENRWVSKNFYHWEKAQIVSTTFSSMRLVLTKMLCYFDPIVRYLQLAYMRKDKTTELTLPGLIAFHPHNTQEKVLKKFKERCAAYDI